VWVRVPPPYLTYVKDTSMSQLVWNTLFIALFISTWLVIWLKVMDDKRDRERGNE